MKSSRPGTIQRSCPSPASKAAPFNRVRFIQRHANSTGPSRIHNAVLPLRSRGQPLSGRDALAGASNEPAMSYSLACDAEHERSPSMIDALAPIWQRVLRRPSIGLEDNFFDLGGDASLADELCEEISRLCGREIPTVAILQAPTIATLAALLEGAHPIRLSPLLLLKPGVASAPVFMAHGLGGTLMEVVPLARHLRSRHPTYGIQARGIDGINPPLERIEDMAQYHLDAIREVQPRGPYLLVGYSLGGLVMLEVARGLVGSGERVALLAMLDAYPHARYLSAGQNAL